MSAGLGADTRPQTDRQTDRETDRETNEWKSINSTANVRFFRNEKFDLTLIPLTWRIG